MKPLELQYLSQLWNCLSKLFLRVIDCSCCLSLWKLQMQRLLNSDITCHESLKLMDSAVGGYYHFKSFTAGTLGEPTPHYHPVIPRGDIWSAWCVTICVMWVTLHLNYRAVTCGQQLRYICCCMGRDLTSFAADREKTWLWCKTFI